jgi:hypothetical protein
MTYALVQICHLVAVALSLRSSMKCLKGLSSSKVIKKDERSTDQLMFWVIFALLSMYEQYFEFLIRWIPGYYYAKAVFIVAISIPRLKITSLVFWDGVVVLINRVYKLLFDENTRTGYEIAMDAPFYILLLLFPTLGNNSVLNQMTDKNSSFMEKFVLEDLPQTIHENIAKFDEIYCELDKKISGKRLSYNRSMEASVIDSDDNEDANLSPKRNPKLAVKNDNISQFIDDEISSEPYSIPSSPVSSRLRSSPMKFSPMNLNSEDPSPRSMRAAKRDTQRRLSTLTSVIRSLGTNEHPFVTSRKSSSDQSSVAPDYERFGSIEEEKNSYPSTSDDTFTPSRSMRKSSINDMNRMDYENNQNLRYSNTDSKYSEEKDSVRVSQTRRRETMGVTRTKMGIHTYTSMHMYSCIHIYI